MFSCHTIIQHVRAVYILFVKGNPRSIVLQNALVAAGGTQMHNRKVDIATVGG